MVPVFNEREVLSQFFSRLSAVLASQPERFELLFVDDGSTDGTQAELDELRGQDESVGIIELSRNFGKEVALTAGIDHASGDAVVLIDADLQEPPELIPELINQWNAGYDVVYAQRQDRLGDPWLKRVSARVFYRVMQRFGQVRLPADAGDFRLMSRRALDSLSTLRESHRFMKGLFAWIGYPQVAVPYVRQPRFAGNTKWNYWSLWNLSIEGFTSFSITPLKAATYLGFATALLAFLAGSWIIFKTLAFGEPVRGYPTIMVTVLFLGGIQLTALGVIGEYLGRTFNETKRRPLYFTSKIVGPRDVSLVPGRDHGEG